MSGDALLQVGDLVVEFSTRAGVARVLDHVSLSVKKGEILGIVGESGCGKSMTALAVMGLVPQPNGRIVGGSVCLAGEELTAASSNRMRAVRGKEISMIFQEPMTSLNPVYTVGDQIAEAVLLHEDVSKLAAAEKAVDMLRDVGIPEPEIRAQNYPHQLSGGMRQRVMIAIALACSPGVLIADEPTTALDVTVQAQIFDLLRELQEKMGTAIILITHDMGAIAEVADQVAVMYAGHVVEQGPVETILNAPQHPYTQGLIRCVPHLDLDPSEIREPLEEIPGVVPALTDLGKGCSFAPRCKFADKACIKAPPNEAVGENHHVRCWHATGGAVL